MKSVKAYYDGDKIRLVNPLPKDLIKKKSFVIITFLDDEKTAKVPKGVRQAVIEMSKNELYDLEEVLDEI